jgi:hypothetical protein
MGQKEGRKEGRKGGREKEGHMYLTWMGICRKLLSKYIVQVNDCCFFIQKIKESLRHL